MYPWGYMHPRLGTPVLDEFLSYFAYNQNRATPGRTRYMTFRGLIRTQDFVCWEATAMVKCLITEKPLTRNHVIED